MAATAAAAAMLGDNCCCCCHCCCCCCIVSSPFLSHFPAVFFLGSCSTAFSCCRSRRSCLDLLSRFPISGSFLSLKNLLNFFSHNERTNYSSDFLFFIPLISRFEANLDTIGFLIGPTWFQSQRSVCGCCIFFVQNVVSCQLPQMSYFFSDKEKPVFFEPVEIFLPSYKFPLARSKNRTFETTFFLFDLKLFFSQKMNLESSSLFFFLTLHFLKGRFILPCHEIPRISKVLCVQIKNFFNVMKKLKRSSLRKRQNFSPI